MQCVYSFLPWSTHKPEPGLLAIGRVTGDVFLAESVTAGAGWTPSLSDIDMDDASHPYAAHRSPASRIKLTLQPGETITEVNRVSSTIVVAATSHGRLFRIRAFLQGAGVYLAASAIAQPRAGFLGRLLGFGSETTAGHGASHSLDSINALDVYTTIDASTESHATLLAADRRAVQLWNLELSSTGGPAADHVANTITTSSFSSALVEALGGTPSAFSEDGLEIASAMFLPSGDVAVLYTYAPSQNRFRSSPSLGTRKLAVCVLPASASTNTSEVLEVDIYPVRDFELHLDARTQSEPKLTAPGGPVLAIVTPNSVVHVVLDKGHRGGISTAFDSMALASHGTPNRTTLHQESYQHILELQSVRQNRIIGLCASRNADARATELLLLTSRTGALRIEIYWPQAREASAAAAKDAASRSALHVKDWQRAIESAVFFGNVPGQPLDLRLHRTIEPFLEGTASLAAAAAERVSREITLGTADLLPALVDVQQHLADRSTRLRSLISVLAEAGVAPQLPVSTRQQLAADAQCVQAAEAVWKENFAFASASTKPLLLIQAIDRAMTTSSFSALAPLDEAPKDTLRTFFRTGLGQWEHVLAQLYQELTDARLATADLATRTRAALQVDGFLVPAHLAAEAVREASKEPAYAAYNLPPAQAPSQVASWIASEADIDLLEAAFHVTVSLVHERSATLGSLVDVNQPVGSIDAFGGTEHSLQAALRNHLPHLASAALQSYEAALAYAQDAGGKGPSGKTRIKTIQQRFNGAKHKLILPLAKLERSDEAIQLAERVQDFDALAIIILDLRDKEMTKKTQLTGSQSSETKSILPKLAPHFLDRYGSPFASAFYRRLLARKEYRTLLAPEQSRLASDKVQHHEILLQDFLHPSGPTLTPSAHDPSQAPAPTPDAAARLRWLVEVGAGKAASASDTLLDLSTNEMSAHKKRLELSLAKLASLAQLPVGPGSDVLRALENHDITDPVTQSLNKMDDQLRGLQSQACLLHLVRTMGQTLGLASIDELEGALEETNRTLMAEHIADEGATGLAQFPALRSIVFVHAISQVLKQEALEAEDLIEAWSLLDDGVQEAEEPPLYEALQTFSRLQGTLPPARAQALLSTLWRRVLLQTDWTELAQTEGLTEVQVRDQLRNTGLYRIVGYCEQAALEVPMPEPNSILSAPSESVLVGRFAHRGSEVDLEALQADLEKEVELLSTSLASTLPSDLNMGQQGALQLPERVAAQLWAWPNQVRRLVVEDREQANVASLGVGVGLGEMGAPPARDYTAGQQPHEPSEGTLEGTGTESAGTASGTSDAAMEEDEGWALHSDMRVLR